ncbi:trl1 [Candida jiufengensis]|uniref:trl1 n=1 Tax=Candida jiufengensis TaxID=497108 RepID=UPI002224D61E|nr:trl1 [Candida jiufengensis]KAI5955050.1 trl1 [Candida jiufengensis]
MSTTNTKEEVKNLCIQLEESTKLKRNGKCIKFTNNVYNTSIPIDSWKFLDFDYGKDKIKLPIQARGLFTFNDEEIVIRGYDKFFNVGEKPMTKEEDLRANTSGPYDVTLKENGCIIFIGGLHTGDIVVCSKHSTGFRDDNTRNHAIEGELQLRKQLGDAKVKELAKYLFDNNLTAISELCDDEFEEHVLPYPKDKSGLYLHGLNYNTINFKTVSINEVNKFADDWGFKLIEYLSFNEYDELFTFLNKCSETGTYNKREVEGFVIRCKKANDDFFFKYKFEEPYLLYRQFREVTRQLIDGVPSHSVRMKKNKLITKKYLEFVEDLFAKEPELKENFAKGHGIIKVRQLFLDHLHETNGMNLLTIDAKLTEELKSLNLEDITKYIIVPVATIGCGKTTVFNTLHLLFPDWIHIQNDNIPNKSKLKIVDLALKALDNYPVVLFDRNNSEFRERKQIFTSIFEKRDTYIDPMIQLKYIGINFINDEVNDDQLWDITYGRIKERGDNHQSIKVNSNEQLTVSVMKGFIKRFRPIDPTKSPDSQFDHVINLKLNQPNSSLENVKLIINNLSETYPDLITTKPTSEQIEKAFKESLDYKPTFTKTFGNNKSNDNNNNPAKKKEPTYFGISLQPQRILKSLNLIESHIQYQNLQKENLVQDKFHITLAHIASTKNKENKKKWQKILKSIGLEKYEEGKNPLDFKSNIKLQQIVINHNKLICIKAQIHSIYNTKGEVIEIEPLNKYIHVTIGCFPPSKPVDSNATIEFIYKGREINDLLADGIYEVDGDVIEVKNFGDDDAVEFEDQQLFAFL